MTSLRSQLMAVHAALGAGDAARARAMAGDILATCPDQIDALQLQAGAALRLGDPAAAADALRRAAQASPASADIVYNLGVAEHAAERHAAAQAAFQRSLELRPGHVDARLGWAEAARAQGDHAGAIAAYREVLAQRSGDGRASDGLVLALGDAGRHDEAIRSADAALARAPGRIGAWRSLALAHEQAGRIDEALDVFDRAARAGLDVYAIAMAHGHLAWRTGRLHAAAAAFARATRARPDGVDAWNNLAASQTRLERIDEAVASARRARALDPAGPNPQLTLAAALSRSREPAQIAESLQLCMTLLARQPDLAAAQDCAAIVQMKRGDADAAERHARLAVTHAPGEPSYRVTLARVLEQRGDLDGAEAVLVDAGSSTEPALPVLRQLGHIQLRRNRPAAALATLDAAWRRDPDDQTGIAERALALGGSDGWSVANAWLGLHEWIRPVDIAVPDGFATRDDFLRALAGDIRAHSQLRYEPVGLVARGGYLTGDLLADATLAITGFAASLRATIAGFIAALPDVPGHPFLGRVPRGQHLMHVWATRVREQGVIDTHLHEGSWLSGAYYVELPPTLGETDGAGWIEFGRPTAGLPAPPEAQLTRVRPEPGLMLFFPSYLFHRTLPYAGDGERISISFDLANL